MPAASGPKEVGAVQTAAATRRNGPDRGVSRGGKECVNMIFWHGAFAVTPKLGGILFDAYGTLFDVHSIAELAEEFWPEHGHRLSQLWRTKQLEYTWQRSLMQRYTGFRRVTEDALAYACRQLKLVCRDSQRAELMAAYLQLRTYPDVNSALEHLKPLRLGVLSNGSPDMLEPLLAHAGLAERLELTISVDAAGTYKPSMQVYQLGAERMGLAREDIGFVSANCWDACGAKAFGFTTFWINRSGAPVDELGAPPDHEVRNLADIPPLLGMP
jgi:2-haloacid dehalogenase